MLCMYIYKIFIFILLEIQSYKNFLKNVLKKIKIKIIQYIKKKNDKTKN